MLIILEGADGTGKTTLAGELVEVLGAKLLHRGPPGQDVITEYARDIQWYRPGQGTHVVCDRWHLGELIYGPLLRGSSAFTRESLAHVEKVLQTRGALLVVLDGDAAEIRGRLRRRGDDLVAVDQIDGILAAYRDVETQLPRYNIRDQNLAVTAKYAARLASVLEHAAERLGAFTTYVGPVTPDFLLVGEQRNGPPYPDQAALTPGPATSGRYLYEALPDAILDGCGFVNALEDDVAALLPILRDPPVCALGVKAADRLREAGVRCSSAPHPQYVRRFYHRAKLEYGALIEDLLTTGSRNELKWRP